VLVRRSVGNLLLVVFFAAGGAVCLVTLLSLAFPGSFMEVIWQLKPEAPAQFEEIGRGLSIALMATVGTACGHGTRAKGGMGTTTRHRHFNR
jgi:hypothetical protein